MDRRIDIGEIPLVGRELAVRVHVPLAQQEQELVFGKLRIHRGEGYHVEGGVPRGEPRVFPLVRHRQDVAREEVRPIGIPPAKPRLRWRLGGSAFEPVFDDIIEKLLGPQQAGIPLAADQALGVRDAFGNDFIVEIIALGGAAGEGFIELLEAGETVGFTHGMQAAAHGDGFPGRDDEAEVGSSLGALGLGRNGVFIAMDQVAMKGVLDVGTRIGGAAEALGVGVVFGEKPFQLRPRRGRIDQKAELAQRVMQSAQSLGNADDDWFAGKVFPIDVPAPGIAKPQGRQDVDGRGGRAAIGDGDAPKNVFRAALGNFLDDIEIATFFENPHVRQLQLGSGASEALVFLTDLGVGIAGLRIFVEGLGVGMGGRGIEVVIALLHVLAVVPLVSAEPEQAFLENRVLPVPKRRGETKPALAVRPPLQAIFSPAVGAAARMIVRKRSPAVAVVGIVLAHSPPLALAQVRSPAPPLLPASLVLRQPLVFPRHHGHSSRFRAG